MFLSMTGFGRASRDFPWGSVTFELTSVNHRYQDFSTRLPREFASMEWRFLSILRAALNRGKVRLSAEVAWALIFPSIIPTFNAAVGPLKGTSDTQ